MMVSVCVNQYLYHGDSLIPIMLVNIRWLIRNKRRLSSLTIKYE